MTNLTTTINPERIYVVEEVLRYETYLVCTCKTKQLAEQVCKYLNSKDKKGDSPNYKFSEIAVIECLPDLVLLAEKGTIDIFAIKPKND